LRCPKGRHLGIRDQTADTFEAGERRVSPLRAADRRRYPHDWPEISKAIRFGRAGGRCECAGECGAGHEGRCEARHGQPHPVTGSKVVLTTAHRDHQPENCDPANLFAACQRCHLRYDADLHRANAAWTRAGRPDQQLELFPGTEAAA
jgi:5-methylcytosine-specific restriction endonuclease McrA